MMHYALFSDQLGKKIILIAERLMHNLLRPELLEDNKTCVDISIVTHLHIRLFSPPSISCL